DSVRVTAPDVGGGFGTKGPVYPEELIVATLARRLGRPVRWSDTREASFASTTHAGDQLHTASLALDRDGTIVALTDDFLADAGGGPRAASGRRAAEGAGREGGARAGGRAAGAGGPPGRGGRGGAGGGGARRRASAGGGGAGAAGGGEPAAERAKGRRGRGG